MRLRNVGFAELSRDQRAAQRVSGAVSHKPSAERRRSLGLAVCVAVGHMGGKSFFMYLETRGKQDDFLTSLTCDLGDIKVCGSMDPAGAFTSAIVAAGGEQDATATGGRVRFQPRVLSQLHVRDPRLARLYTALLGFHWAGCLFSLISFSQMAIWAAKKLRNYKTQFASQVPPNWKAIVPFLL